MKHLFLNKKLSLLAKEKGFNERCFAYYTKKDSIYLDQRINSQQHYTWQICSAPLYQQIIDWFREEHNITIKVQQRTFSVKSEDGWYFDFNDKGSIPIDYYKGGKTYYETLDKAIKKAFKLI